jgi:hypothetical protein
MTPSQAPSQFDVLHSGLQGASTASAQAEHGGGAHRSDDDFVRTRFLRESAAYLELDGHRIAATARGIARMQ